VGVSSVAVPPPVLQENDINKIPRIKQKFAKNKLLRIKKFLTMIGSFEKKF
jgi:hypothetical protein